MVHPKAAPNIWPYYSHRGLDAVMDSQFRIMELQALNRFRPLNQLEEAELDSLCEELIA